MYNHAFVKAFQLTDLVSPLANQVSVPDSKGLAHNSRVIWLVIAGMSVATIVGYWATGLTFAWYCIQTIGLCALPFLAVSLFYRRLRPDPLISFATEAFAQLLLVLTLGSALSYPLAAAGFPYRDALLNSADTWMGLDWRAYLKFVNDRPLLGTITKLAYDSPLAQLMVLMTILVPTLRFVRLQRFVLANALGLCIALAVFTFVPAAGIYSFLNIEHSEFGNLSPVMTTDQQIYLDALRSGQHMLVDEMSGLITFPSFHAAWAFFFMWAFYPVKWLGTGAILLNLVVLAATPVQGAHYFIDLIGGAIVAAISIYGAVRLTSAARPEVNGPAL
jgi:membrane-associated phospholipid phosphatase